MEGGAVPGCLPAQCLIACALPCGSLTRSSFVSVDLISLIICFRVGLRATYTLTGHMCQPRPFRVRPLYLAGIVKGSEIREESTQPQVTRVPSCSAIRTRPRDASPGCPVTLFVCVSPPSPHPRTGSDSDSRFPAGVVSSGRWLVPAAQPSLLS